MGQADRLPLSINLMPKGPVGALLDVARQAEASGFAHCWVYDEGLATRDVWVTLAAVAGATERMTIGPGITNPIVRHPGATATALATLDELSGGRAVLGLGAGGGLTLSPLGLVRRQPVATVEAMVQALRGLFAGESTTVATDTFSFDDARLDYGRSDIEIVLAGRGPRMTALGGRIADGFNLSWVHKDLLGDHTAALRQAAGPRRFRIEWSTMLITDERDLEAARTQLSFRLPDMPASVRERLGVGDDVVARIRRLLAQGGPTLAAQAVEPTWVLPFVVHGSPDACVAEVRERLRVHEIDRFQVPTFDLDDASSLIERLAAGFGH